MTATSPIDADVLIVGGGIAGLAAAYFARAAGRAVTVVDAGHDCASRVPTAMINPFRGYRGRVSETDIAGARFTLDLIAKLCAAGHEIASGRGVWRPVPDGETREQWSARLPSGVAHRWVERAHAPPLLSGDWPSALYLPDSGWVESAPLLSALRSEARCEWVTGRVVLVDARAQRVTLADGQTFRARTLVWCGGALGAASIAKKARYRPGSVLVTAERVSEHAVSYGLYTAPHGAASVIGPTTEAMFTEYPAPLDEDADERADGPVGALIERAQNVLPLPFTVASRWRGVRLESGLMPADLATLTVFGSRGFLLAPRAAEEWARSL